MDSAGTTRQGSSPKAPPRLTLLCPYCGAATPQGPRCAACRGLLDPLSRQASQNAMGPWFLRDESAPFMPGCSYETLVGMVRRGKITRRTVLRGPTTRQFWCTAERTPGLSHLFGVCHNCRVDVQPTDSFCDECGAGFTVEPDRQHLGLGPVHLLPGQATPESIADAGLAAPPAPEHDEPVPPPRVRREAAPAPDLTPLVHALRRRVRRLKLVVLLVFFAGVAGIVWAVAPRGAIERWLDERGIRFSPAPPPAGSSLAESESPNGADPDPAPPVISGNEAGVPRELGAQADSKVEAPAADPPSPAPGPPGEPGPESPVSARPTAVPTWAMTETAPDALERLAAGLDDEELRRAVERRAAQLRARPFP